MWDFQYRVAMDTYEQMNGKPKAPTTYVPVDTPAKPGLLRRVLQSVLGRRTWQPSGKAITQPNASPRVAR